MKKTVLFTLSALLFTSYVSCKEIQNISDENQLEQVEQIELNKDELLLKELNDIFAELDLDIFDDKYSVTLPINKKSKISQFKDAITLFRSLPRDVKKDIAKEVASVFAEHVKSHKIAYGIGGIATLTVAPMPFIIIKMLLFPL